MAPGSSTSAKVMVVEDRAHLRRGHFPTAFAFLADGFVRAGSDVEVLTACGWSMAKEMPHEFGVHRFGHLARWFHRLVDGDGSVTTDARRRGPVRNRVRSHLTSLVTVIEARRLAAKLGPEPGLIVVVKVSMRPMYLLLLGGRHRWLVRSVHPHPMAAPWESRLLRALDRRGVELAKVGLLTFDDAAAARAMAVLPMTSAAVVPFAGVRPMHGDRDASRRRFGIDSATKVALLLGANHGAQEPAVVIDAFRGRTDWQLLVVGRVATAFDPEELSAWSRPPVIIGGFVDDETCREALIATDIVVLSYVAPRRADSGVFMEAISAGRPVIASDDSWASAMVRQWRVGEVFTSGSASALSDALDRIDLASAAAAVPALHREFEFESVARRHLELQQSL